MANVNNGNTLFIDSTGNVSDTRGLTAKHVIVTATAASASLILRDQDTGNSSKLRVDIASAGSVVHLPLEEHGIYFPNGVNVGTATNCVATLVYRRA